MLGHFLASFSFYIGENFNLRINKFIKLDNIECSLCELTHRVVVHRGVPGCQCLMELLGGGKREVLGWGPSTLCLAESPFFSEESLHFLAEGKCSL